MNVQTISIEIGTIKEATAITGGLGKPAKMPGRSWGISPELCNTGSKLRKIPGSVCSTCYACKGRYMMESAIQAHINRINAYRNDVRWQDAMVKLIGREKHFRWFDSGDLQGMEMLEHIVQICKRTPGTKHWLPTHEHGLIRRFIRKGGKLPENLVVRMSAAMVAGPAPKRPKGVQTSTVHKNGKAQGRKCPAPKQGGECGDCRSCWNRRVANVSYHEH